MYMVSVNIITYNHEKYIAQAIEGALMQVTNFPVELVICDDCSRDNTRAILKEYADKYPEKIRLRLREKNVGLLHNYFDNILACKGKYVAICEGDDYWTDLGKLQAQVDFLEANPAYSMCFQNAMELHQYDDQPDTSNIFRELEERTYTGTEILSNWLIPTVSVVFRKPASLPFRHLDKFLFYDIVLFLRLAEQGKLYCMNQVMSVYRRHSQSITNSNLRYEDYLRHLTYLDEEFNGAYRSVIRRAIAEEYAKRSKYAFKEHSARCIELALKSLWHDPRPLSSLVTAKLTR